jgi:hypothetical protein
MFIGMEMGNEAKITDKNAKILIATDCLRTINNIFMETFFLAFLFKYSRYDIRAIGIYHVLAYATMIVMAYFTGNWVKRGNRILMYRMGIIVTFFYMVLFVILKCDKNNRCH